MTLLETLQQWQTQQARREGVEGYRVLPYKTLVELARVMPRTEEELLAVKGIGAVKARRYGPTLLQLISAATTPDSAPDAVSAGAPVAAQPTASRTYTVSTGEVTPSDDDVFGVSDFLSALNVLLSSHFRQVRVRGEVVGLRRNTTGHAYFQIKDAQGVLRVTVFRGAYELSGVELADGMEVIVTGHPQHHTQYGFSFIGETVELAGEGALKKAYDALKKKLAQEGLLDAERKRGVPQFATKIGLITSRDGAAIGDFMTNLGKYGLRVTLVHSAVEGQHAVHELRAALMTLRARAEAGALDVLVITRGGGSLESLQAFNNETIVRMIADFPVPVVAGIGHERDETLATLVADAGVSTPTAAAKAVSASWMEAAAFVAHRQRVIVQRYTEVLGRTAHSVAHAPMVLTARFQELLARFSAAQHRLAQHAAVYAQSLARTRQHIARAGAQMCTQQQRHLRATHTRLDAIAALLRARDPHTLLARGYAIVRGQHGVVRSTQDVKAGDALSIRLSDGTIEATAE